MFGSLREVGYSFESVVCSGAVVGVPLVGEDDEVNGAVVTPEDGVLPSCVLTLKQLPDVLEVEVVTVGFDGLPTRVRGTFRVAPMMRLVDTDPFTATAASTGPVGIDIVGEIDVVVTGSAGDPLEDLGLRLTNVACDGAAVLAEVLDVETGARSGSQIMMLAPAASCEITLQSLIVPVDMALSALNLAGEHVADSIFRLGSEIVASGGSEPIPLRVGVSTRVRIEIFIYPDAVATAIASVECENAGVEVVEV